MSPFFLSWLGPLFFISSVMLSCVKNGDFIWKKEGLILLVFALQHIRPIILKIKPVIWCLSFCAFLFGLGVFFSLYSVSLILSSAVSLACLKEFLRDEKKQQDQSKLLDFYQKKLIDELKNRQIITDKLDTFLEQNLEFTFVDQNFETKFFEDYDESLDFEEKIISEEMKSFQKLEKKPLKRLRRILMKQTTFFDEESQTGESS